MRLFGFSSKYVQTYWKWHVKYILNYILVYHNNTSLMQSYKLQLFIWQKVKETWQGIKNFVVKIHSRNRKNYAIKPPFLFHPDISIDCKNTSISSILKIVKKLWMNSVTYIIYFFLCVLCFFQEYCLSLVWSLE